MATMYHNYLPICTYNAKLIDRVSTYNETYFKVQLKSQRKCPHITGSLHLRFLNKKPDTVLLKSSSASESALSFKYPLKTGFTV